MVVYFCDTLTLEGLYIRSRACHHLQWGGHLCYAFLCNSWPWVMSSSSELQWHQHERWCLWYCLQLGKGDKPFLGREFPWRFVMAYYLLPLKNVVHVVFFLCCWLFYLKLYRNLCPELAEGNWEDDIFSLLGLVSQYNPDGQSRSIAEVPNKKPAYGLWSSYLKFSWEVFFLVINNGPGSFTCHLFSCYR